MFAHLPGKVGQYQVPFLIVQLYPEHGIWQGFTNNAFNFYCFFFCHKRSS